MGKLYSIKEETLTGLADAIRGKVGATETKVIQAKAKVSKTSNATSHDSLGKNQYLTYNCNTVTINGASYLKVIMTANGVSDDYVRMAAGSYDDRDNFPSRPAAEWAGPTAVNRQVYTIPSTDTVTFLRHFSGSSTLNKGYYAEVVGFKEDGTPVNINVGSFVNIEFEDAVKKTFQPTTMANILDALPTIPDEAFVISGNCNYRFTFGGFDWFIEKCGDKITTENINDAAEMFYCSNVTEIPFELNFSDLASNDYHEFSKCFSQCKNLTNIPKINNCRPYSTVNLFDGCHNLRTLPEDIENWFDWSYMESQTSASAGSRQSMFYSCYSLRSIPIGFLNHNNKNLRYTYSYFCNGFNSAYALDELLNLPLPYTSEYTSDTFSNTFMYCRRLKNLTFALQEDGTPYVMKWKSQNINLSNELGWSSGETYILNFNSGITADKEVKDDAGYQALKDDPDWWTRNVAYSRYNHDSAVATINSLPDTSAYLAEKGGTNTIKFKGAAGSATDGGAINTLTEEEIAVATAKGWTVTLV
jgi:hypothetical protein